jgi:hypothetical protein
MTDDAIIDLAAAYAKARAESPEMKEAEREFWREVLEKLCGGDSST